LLLSARNLRNVHQDSKSDQGRQETGASITDQGKGISGEGDQANHHAHIDKCFKRDPERETGRQK
jgi:hypothetical protein